MHISSRAERIAPFMVMEVAKAAQTLAAQTASSDMPMVFLNIGEPDFQAPPSVQAAAQRLMNQGQVGYTPALGIAPLREAISGWYATRFGL
ncbi:MAG: aminotransferase, partial [Burkholderiaceae bacterium]|nr:aminotransferase [Burkholderiaceae bacterium]